MAKVCIKEFPMGSYPGQRSDGMFINDGVKHSIDILARNIQKDMQFVGLYTGDGTVRNGKSTCAQQHAYYYSWQVSKLTGKTIPFNMNNIVFRAEDLITKAFELPKYSCIILDEGDDLTAHYFSHLAKTLKKFFRKCGQLNLFIILILPDFFELPSTYALIRSNFLVNVHFLDEFARGFFKFYGPKAKKNLYLYGKRWKDYDASPPNFPGKFIHLYTVDEKEYRKAKLEDMMLSEEEEISTRDQLRIQKMKLLSNARELLPDIELKTWYKVFETSKTTVWKHFNKNVGSSDIAHSEVSRFASNYNNITLENENYVPDQTKREEVINNEDVDRQQG